MPLDTRSDTGALWENFFITERMKYRKYHNIYASQHYWRSYAQSEVDLIEEHAEKLIAYECKWSTKKSNVSQDFQNTYNTLIQVVTPDNFLQSLT